MTELLMGNEAIGLGAIRAGVSVVTGYPGTPSSEILETIAKHNKGNIYVEWSVNEKSALEVAAGAAYAGARTLVTMKQVGLNVASDPLMSLAYIGVKGGMVIVSADDPGPISSQTEQDTRHFAQFAKLPVFDPCSPEEAYQMIADAFDYSEKYNTPVIFRPTTRVCHGCASVEIQENMEREAPEGFIKDARWAIFPRLSYQNHIKIEQRTPILSKDFSGYKYNTITGGVGASSSKGIAVGGISYTYAKEALASLKEDIRLLRIATPNPFPRELALEFLEGLNEVLVIEELDPVIEQELLKLCGELHIKVTIKGKLTGNIQQAGENTVESVSAAVAKYLGLEYSCEHTEQKAELTPARPPVLCAGCPHRASFYAVKTAMKGKKAVFSGDIGCYTLGNAAPLDMVDTCLCMGAGITVAQGLHRVEPDTHNFAFIGDSTFFHTGIAGVVNAVYNETDITLIVLDNSTTAMTGHQPHPGTGKTMMGNISEKISIEGVLRALGVTCVEKANPLNHIEALSAVERAASVKGISAVIFESPCIAVCKASEIPSVNDNCKNCKRCISELGCPAISLDKEKGRVRIDKTMCYGCGLCSQVCPFDAIK